jgi:hypothetical protein
MQRTARDKVGRHSELASEAPSASRAADSDQGQPAAQGFIGGAQLVVVAPTELVGDRGTRDADDLVELICDDLCSRGGESGLEAWIPAA